MNSLCLKILAISTMAIDHLGIALANSSIISFNSFLYITMRALGRFAFPLFIFLLSQGAYYTKNKPIYALRLFALAIISEIPFNLFFTHKAIQININDFALSNIGFIASRTYQNVLFTLFFGVVCIFLMQLIAKWIIQIIKNINTNIKSKLKIICKIVLCLNIIIICLFCTSWFNADYGIIGVLASIIMGMSKLMPIEAKLSNNKMIGKKTNNMPFNNISNIVFYALMCTLLFVYESISFAYSFFVFFTIIFIVLYNEEKGYNKKIIQYSFYLFYPVHLLILYIIF